MSRLRRAVMVALVMVSLTACVAPVEGTVTKKVHEPTWIEVRVVCIAYTANGWCGGYSTNVVPHPELWRLTLEGPDGKVGSREVSEQEWSAVEVGDYWRMSGSR